MILVEANHSLENTEVASLKSLIGQSIAFIRCAKDGETGPPGYHDFDDAVNLQTGEGMYVAVSGEFSETELGEDFIRAKIEKRETLLSTNHAPMARLTEPFFSLGINQPFTIRSIEVYGYSYQVSSANDKAPPYWQIEKNHPGQAVAEQIETQNILLFYATDGRRLLVKPHGAVPWMTVTLDDTLIKNLLQQINLEGEVVTQLKIRLE